MEKILEFFGLLGFCFFVVWVMRASFEKDVHRASRQAVIDAPDEIDQPQDFLSTLLIGVLCVVIVVALVIVATHEGIKNGVVGN